MTAENSSTPRRALGPLPDDASSQGGRYGFADLSDDFDDAGFDGLDGLAQGPSWDAPSS